ncbi:hemerythrin domain-containing protein [Azohydromonas aeria]|uniref:hemerythrin domain-containing protein n=1 Tax=Azohydromonas aeria TaxID=2590212 RepID=UPI0012F83AC2|nr:hemerythrin domain-containing protein [Azohydromonas aeria]
MDALQTRVRPERPAVPLIDPMTALDLTHREVLVQIGRLQELLARIENDGADAQTRALAAEIEAFFSGHARKHHEDEEEQVFPLLLAQGDAELVQQVKRLQQDHGWLEEDWLELGPQLAGLAAGYSGYDVDLLRHGVAVFADLYLEHISLEEGLVFPAARKLLGARRAAAAPA